MLLDLTEKRERKLQIKQDRIVAYVKRLEENKCEMRSEQFTVQKVAAAIDQANSTLSK